MLRRRDGFTILETLIVVGMIALISGVVLVFQNDLFSINFFLQRSLSIQRDTEAVIKQIIAELRTATPSNTGSYPIEKAEASSLAFYANIDSDPLKERVHYFRNGSRLMKSVVKPVGQPGTYSTTTATESLLMVLNDVVASTTAPLFSYYDSSYAGTTSSLALPINIPAVRLIKVTMIVDEDPAKIPPPIIVSSQVTIRNLKNNQ